MTNQMHKIAITGRLTSFLRRRAKPRHLAEDEQATDAEIEALARRIVAYAPTDQAGLAEWWERFERRLEDAGNGRHWPSPREVSEAASQTPRSARQAPDAAVEVEVGSREWQLDVLARRIREGLPVSEMDLWGRNAVELIRSGRVDREQIERARLAYTAELVDLYGEAAAAARIAQLAAHHEACLGAASERPQTGARPDRRASAAAAARILATAAASVSATKPAA
ncbi:hypothetical protein LV82_02572 [Albidovulum inexpectatum]|uniref:Uncharacterized protein n=1 Tax=Albidovulum inexpectatum TaxID=196587 RepID=A0A2S5JED4_9RHOB|nr:hypothetical protein [Albidovulum inexpectatum]PPB79781.1 hypothetical protein LV82_02572 [Albidovulum inexpectatum]